MALKTNTTITRMMDSPDYPVTVHAKQNDRRTRFVTLQCFDTENDFSIPEGAAGVVRVRKSDGKACFYDVNDLGDPAVVINGNSITVELVEQAVAASGLQKVEVNLYTPDGGKITTFSFDLQVEASVLTDADVISSDYYNVLTSEISSALAAAIAADVSAEEAAAQAAEAAASESAAAQSKAAAASSASAAKTSETNADASKTAAANSAAAAATSEANAASSMSAAANSAAAAKTSETNAAASKTAAEGSASSAAQSEAAAEAAAQRAEDAAEKIDMSNYLLKTGDGKDVTVTFSPSSDADFSAPVSGSKLSAVMVMLSKWRNFISRALTPTGAILSYAGNSAPVGFLLCDGRAVSRTTYAALFAVIGTTFGSGDGSSTFNLPDMRGRVAVGVDSDANLGVKSGAKNHALTNAELPVLSGSIVMHSSNTGTNIQTVNGIFKPAITNNGKYRGGGDLVSDAGASSVGHFSLNIGGGQAMSLMQPSLHLHYIVKV